MLARKSFVILVSLERMTNRTIQWLIPSANSLAHNTTSHSQQHTEKEDTIRETQGKQGKREERKHMFSPFSFACDGGGAIDIPQRVHMFLLVDAVSSTFSQVDLTQLVEK